MSTTKGGKYLLRIAFLGFRYHGWQVQPGQHTLEEKLQKTFRFVLPDHRVSILGAGRTDAKVSAFDFAVQLGCDPDLVEPLESVLERINDNLPQDMMAHSIEPVAGTFNAIRDASEKHYAYYFSFGEKPHPYCAPLLGYFPGPLDIDCMKEAAVLFQGEHDFQAFISSDKPGANRRRIVRCEISENTALTASFFPEKSYVMHARGAGFGRYQVRLMMSALVVIGRGEAGLSDLRESLDKGAPWPGKSIAPGSGLHLMHTSF
ncbi:tRNA pseudouridine38-40 synthase [Robiginitalea myxolifaciens]|uniref:tRNA pseudouridine synthase A n=1 Tax=Robiginitalea myxolifaciens TaxID=400055 RepID=A0A1I6GWZ3_9FLAO|nr:tRNA pseudouridine synthase A [Robiginitalea myxolifaciens]SFR46755.1 tRNA pseudouridine38-40 synthase [Robiginitalea myxolifaciens]